MMFIINPGTEAREDTSEQNALVVAKHIASEFKKDFPDLQLRRDTTSDDEDGWYGFKLVSGGTTVDIAVPGDNPEEVMQSTPFTSRRLYVDGSSWLFGYAMGIIADSLTPTVINKERN